MHSNMKQNGIENDCARPIFVRSTELWNFEKQLGPCPWDDVTTLTL